MGRHTGCLYNSGVFFVDKIEIQKLVQQCILHNNRVYSWALCVRICLESV